MLDVGGMSGRDPMEDFRVINRELALYSDKMADLPQVVALNKMDIAADPEGIDRIQKALEEEGHTVFRTAAATRQGLEPLLYHVWDRLEAARANQPPAHPYDVTVIKAGKTENVRDWEISRDFEGVWVVQGKGFERLVAMTDLNNEHAVSRLQRSLERAGVHRKLKEAGCQDGDTVRIGSSEFDFEDEDIEREMTGRRRRR
jgi:GTP-binding protein